MHIAIASVALATLVTISTLSVAAQDWAPQCYGDSIEVRFGARSGGETVAAAIPLDISVSITAFGLDQTFVDPLAICLPEPVLIQSAYFTFNHKAWSSLGISADSSWRRMELAYSAVVDGGAGLQANQAALAQSQRVGGGEVFSNGFLKLYPTDSVAGDYVFPPDFTDRVEHFVQCAPTVFDVECNSHVALPERLALTYWFYASKVSVDDWMSLEQRVKSAVNKLITQ